MGGKLPRKTSPPHNKHTEADTATQHSVKNPQELLQTLIDTIEGEVFVKDFDGKYLFVNNAFGKDFDVDKHEVIGKDDFSIFSPETAAMLQQNDRQIMDSKKAANIEESAILRGKPVTFLTNKVPLLDDDGDVFGICGVGFDITHQKNLEKTLKKSRVDLEKRVAERTEDLQTFLRFEQLLSNLSAKFIDLPPETIDREIEFGLGQIRVLFNLDRCALFELIPDPKAIYLTHTTVGKGLDPTPKGSNLEPHFPWISGRVLSGEIVSINTEDFPPEASVDKRSSRDLIPFRHGLHIPLNFHGEVRYMIGMTVDSSESIPEDDFIPRLRMIGEIFVGALERIKAYRSLSESEVEYRIVADFTYDWEYWSNLDGTLKYVSPSCERISGYTPQDFIDKPSLVREIILVEDRDLWSKHYQESRLEPGKREIRFRIRHRDGAIRWIEHACQPVIGEQGDVLGFRASNRDITRRAEGELRLKKAYVEIAAMKKRLKADQTYLREEIKLEHDHENIIGDSDVMRYVLFRAEQVASTDTNVLILGETGTGKELIARAIHNASLRRERPLVKVDCASLPANLIESELFGHEKGAFTGAVEKRKGRFEVAHGATIFLDEIGELPLELQPKLLRVLQDGEFERLGSSRTLKADVRVIAATNRDLEKDIQVKKFRMDLWYRLSVFTISIPPLRERKNDIILLVNYLVGRLRKKFGKQIISVATEVIDRLQHHSWPGNVRELENVIERAVINTQGDVLRLDDTLDAYRFEEAAPPGSPMKSLEEIEREHIMLALKKTNWTVHGHGGAASLLKIHPSTLRGRMRKHGINRPLFKT